MSNNSKVKPLFLLSLPRAGSTLLQRILTSHDKVHSVAEPWVLLPLMNVFSSDENYADFDYPTYKRALKDFCQELPNGEQQYKQEIGKAVSRMYGAASPEGTEYFLDKTPRYSVIAEDLITAFPEGKFVVLWRNPLSAAASMVESFAKGNWNLHYYRFDLFDGIQSLCGLVKKYPDSVYQINYEKLLVNPEGELKKLFEYLELEFNSKVISNFSEVKFQGKLGDPTGRKMYQAISTSPLTKWKKTFHNPLRKGWAKAYLKWLGPERIELMGYDYSSLEKDVKDIQFGFKNFFSDIMRMTYGKIEPIFNFNILRRRKIFGNKTGVKLLR